eukprot:3775676-Prymnesium_polylepis.2
MCIRDSSWCEPRACSRGRGGARCRRSASGLRQTVQETGRGCNAELLRDVMCDSKSSRRRGSLHGMMRRSRSSPDCFGDLRVFGVRGAARLRVCVWQLHTFST